MRSSEFQGAAMRAVTASAAALLALDVQAADTSKLEEIDVIVVTGSRLPRDLSSVPGSVTVVDLEEITKQRATSNDLTRIMELAVPGLGISSFPNWGTSDQTLRGRKPAILIDGVPTTTPLRDGGRDLRTVGASAIERMEVIRGSTAIYGLGGAGGLINYVTKMPGEGEPEFFTRVASGFSTEHTSDSFNGEIEQGASGRVGRFSYVATGSYEKYSSLFDADGERLPPDPNRQGGVADNDIYSLFGKVGYDLTDSQTVQLSVNKYHAQQDSDYISGMGQYLVTQTPAIRGGDPRQRDQFIDNLMMTARYTNASIFGRSSLNVLGYYSEYQTRFSFFPLPNFPPDGGQTLLDSNKRGVRLDVATPVSLLDGGRVLWGVDFSGDKTKQPLNDGRTYAPLMDQTTYAPFLQAELDVSSWLKLRGGVRYEDITIEVPTFTTLRASLTVPGGVTVQGGSLDYSATVYNVGAVVNFTPEVSIFAGFSQGFSVADIGGSLRTTTVNSIERFDAEAQLVDTYEAGLRFNYPTWRASAATFVSKSDLGATYSIGTFAVVRAKEEVTGYEGTIDWMISDRFTFGATYSSTDGRRDTNDDGQLDEPLDSTRISPAKATAYLEVAATPDWLTRLSVLNASSQNRFPNDPRPISGRARMEGYTLVDLTTSFPIGPGTLGLGIRNLLNKEYYTLSSQRQVNGATYVPGQGRTATVTYSVRY